MKKTTNYFPTKYVDAETAHIADSLTTKIGAD
jgi:hypothetical protein